MHYFSFQTLFDSHETLLPVTELPAVSAYSPTPTGSCTRLEYCGLYILPLIHLSTAASPFSGFSRSSLALPLTRCSEAAALMTWQYNKQWMEAVCYIVTKVGIPSSIAKTAPS